jgi:hypothetical protein
MTTGLSRIALGTAMMTWASDSATDFDDALHPPPCFIYAAGDASSAAR